MTTSLRAALYLRVSTARQAEHDISIPTSAGREKPIAPHAATSSSRPMSSRVRPRRMIAGPSSSG